MRTPSQHHPPLRTSPAPPSDFCAHRLERRRALDRLAKAVRFMETEALSKRPGDGPYWFGPELSLVDLTFYPWFEQLAVRKRFRDFRMPTGLTRLSEWREVDFVQHRAEIIPLTGR
jgi:glutathione S-transferase